MNRAVTVALAAPALLIAAFALFGPWLVNGPPDAVVAAPYSPVGPGLPLGSDHLGRSTSALLLAGGHAVLLVPVVATAVACTLGALLGVAAGYLGGWLDRVITMACTVLLSGPPMMLIMLLLVVGWGASNLVLGVAVVLSSTPFVARLVRATTHRVAAAGHVELAPCLGAGRVRVMVQEVLPGTLGPLLVDAGMRFVTAVYLVSAASFLGLATEADNWAAMVRSNIDGLPLTRWPVLLPAALLAALTVSANLSLDRLARRVQPG